MNYKSMFAIALLGLAAAQAHAAGCLATGNGYLRARVGGALNLDIDWRNAELECEGSPRPDGSGVRVSFAGPARSDGRRVRMVFGIGGVREGSPGHGLRTNLTVMFEGEQRLFATRGDDRCTVDDLSQERVGALGGNIRSYRVIARGFCVAPASTLKGDEQIVVSRFDFAGLATFEDDIADLGTFPRTTLEIRSGAKRHKFNIWVAATPEQRMQGLMFVSDLPANEGMIFLEREPRDMRLWMKNTLIPLDMLFIDAKGSIVRIAENTEPFSLATISAGEPVAAVLELKGGEAARRSIRSGDAVTWKPL
jgi:uncharacterized membrane protein (UPF0127 family)